MAKHGTTLPPNMQGLTDDQIEELHLEDKWSKTCIPQGGDSKLVVDPVGRRNGKAPCDKMADLLHRTREGAKTMVSKVGLKSVGILVRDGGTAIKAQALEGYKRVEIR